MLKVRNWNLYATVSRNSKIRFSSIEIFWAYTDKCVLCLLCRARQLQKYCTQLNISSLFFQGTPSRAKPSRAEPRCARVCDIFRRLPVPRSLARCDAMRRRRRRERVYFCGTVNGPISGGRALVEKTHIACKLGMTGDFESGCFEALTLMMNGRELVIQRVTFHFNPTSLIVWFFFFFFFRRDFEKYFERSEQHFLAQFFAKIFT